ncbi:MAG: GNAT family N-acetyltransferase [Gemmatimonadetes bacterium]|nr:GNAT family N-acetyltransferase [Gemmatimonadota bacterium]
MSAVDVTLRPMRADEAAACEGILRDLPDWFGIEEAIVSYRRDIESLETWVAETGEGVAGFLTLKPHNEHSAEIQVLAVRAPLHARGVGRALVEHAEGLLRTRRVDFFQVKTLGPSRSNANYDRTRGFYLRMGFLPLEENKLWGEGNPCLILVKHLACGRS